MMMAEWYRQVKRAPTDLERFANHIDDDWSADVLQVRKHLQVQRRRRLALALAFTAAVAACTWAGYATGLAKGRGWRGAMVDGGCAVVCRGAGT